MVKNKEFKVSVIIPTYNRQAYISRAINSVIAQTITVDEIIIVDNQSNDNTIEYLKKKFKKIKILVANNRGVSFARNLGIRESKNKWIAFLDSDDEWLPSKLEKQFLYLKQQKFQLSLVHTNELWFKNDISPKIFYFLF